MTGISERPSTKMRAFAAAAAAAAAVGLAACSAPGGTPAATATKTVTQSAPTSDSTAKPRHASANRSGRSGGTAPVADMSAHGTLARYRPSAVVSKSAYATVLTSPDPVSKIGAFYQKALASGGWHVTSTSKSAYHASFTAHRGHQGVSISVYSRGNGSGISISTHPR